MSDDMRRAESAFDQARYEDVEVWLSSLEPELPQMDRALRARFYYLRGTTAYRLEDPVTARHYLALAEQEERRDAAALRPQWHRDLKRMMEKLAPPGGPAGPPP